jgi:hypothetical protein
MRKGLARNGRPEGAISEVWQPDISSIFVDALMAWTRSASSVPFISGMTTFCQEEVNRLGLHDPQGLLRITGVEDDATPGVERLPSERAQLWFVIHNEFRLEM